MERGVPYRVRFQDHYSGLLKDLDNPGVTLMEVRGVYAGDQMRRGVRYALFFNWNPPHMKPGEGSTGVGPVDLAFIVKAAIIEVRRIP
jgi:hypothetical protein